jgi:hypothetical protein
MVRHKRQTGAVLQGPSRFTRIIVFATLLGVSHGVAEAQARATGVQGNQLSVFGGATGTFTGLNSGRNLGITGGVDLRFRPLPFFHLLPSLEVRGTYPVDQGGVIGERSILGGLKVERHFGRLRPYLDGLFGRGQINYVQPLPNPSFTFFYLQTTSNVLSGGAGVDFAVTDHLDLKAEVQLQRWATPVLSNGHFESEPLTAGFSYYLDFNRLYNRRKSPRVREVHGDPVPNSR